MLSVINVSVSVIYDSRIFRYIMNSIMSLYVISFFPVQFNRERIFRPSKFVVVEMILMVNFIFITLQIDYAKTLLQSFP
jgi:hypothetical protein